MIEIICFKRRLAWLCAIALGSCQILHARPSAAEAGRAELQLNDGWSFSLAEAGTNSSGPPEAAAAFDDSKWEKVFLPHTPRVEQPENTHNYFQGVCWYRRHVAPQAAWRGKKVSLLFEGAMQLADVWVNGRHALTHRGGYLPFSVDITDALAEPGGATVAVRRTRNSSSRIRGFQPGLV